METYMELTEQIKKTWLQAIRKYGGSFFGGPGFMGKFRYILGGAPGGNLFFYETTWSISAVDQPGEMFHHTAWGGEKTALTPEELLEFAASLESAILYMAAEQFSDQLQGSISTLKKVQKALE